MSEETILEMQKGEGRWVRFEITNDGLPLDMSAAVLFFGIKRNRTDSSYVYNVENSESAKWNRTEDSTGTVRVNIPASVTSTMDIDNYDASLRVIITADTDVDISPMFTLKIIPSVIH
jgi:hypothetical protein